MGEVIFLHEIIATGIKFLEMLWKKKNQMKKKMKRYGLYYGLACWTGSFHSLRIFCKSSIKDFG